SVTPGYALADRIEALKHAAAEMNMPAAYTTAVSGKGRELERTFTEFLWAFMLSIIFMYMILASQFESTIHPITILLSLPLAVPFAMLSQWATGDTLNVYSIFDDIGTTATWRRLAARVRTPTRRAAAGLRDAFARSRRRAEAEEPETEPSKSAATHPARRAKDETVDVERPHVGVGAGGD